jgi:hypothetical protein
MTLITTQDLISALQESDPTGTLPVFVAQSDTHDVRLDTVLLAGTRVVLMPQVLNEESVMPKFDILPEETGEFRIALSYAGETIPVGPPTYDFLVAERVQRMLFEREGAFLEAYNLGQHHEFVAGVYDEIGGT